MSEPVWCIEQGDCLEVLKRMPDACVDAVVTDPPAGIEFMGKEWDSFKKKESESPKKQTGSWGSMNDGKNAYASVATPRYRGKTNESLQGFQDFICEVFTEVYRVLKPGGHAVVWALPRTSHHTAMGLERAGFDIRDNGTYLFHVFGSGFPKSHNLDGAWEGWGTALKPAVEFWIVARKPLDGTVAENMLEHGTGALNLDGCRIGTEVRTYTPNASQQERTVEGRWPAHLILNEGAAALLDEQSGGDGASRFFYVPKTSRRDKDEGLDDLPERTSGEKTDREEGSAGITPYAGSRGPSRNIHPTVKPTALMAYLCRLVTPPGGIVLDPFMGSGSTGKAALLEGFSFIGIERENEYVEIATARLRHADNARKNNKESK